MEITLNIKTEVQLFKREKVIFMIINFFFSFQINRSCFK